jgi:polyketide synthase PksN
VLDLADDEPVERLAERIGAHDAVDHVVWLTPPSASADLADDRVIGEQTQGVLSGFRLIKALLHLGYETKELGWTVVTWQTQCVERNEHARPAHASVHGLVGSLAKEYEHWKIRLVDLPEGETDFEHVLRVPPDPRGDVRAYRAGEWHKQQLSRCELSIASTASFRQQGVYVVIGGAGGIGEALTEYLIRDYDARVVWIGRRALDEQLRAKLDRLGKLGRAPDYFRANASDREALEAAHREIKTRYAEVHGVVHTAIALLDKSLAQMDEARFRAGLAAKVDVSVRLAQVFAQETLDFVLFFSSLQSFEKAALSRMHSRRSSRAHGAAP